MLPVNLQWLSTSANQSDLILLLRIARFVEQRLDDEDLSISDLRKEVFISKSHLHRKIKTLTNLSPSAFVRTIRLQHAYVLLEQKTGTISEIAFQVGIPNLAYFSRRFKEHFGFPPSRLLYR